MNVHDHIEMFPHCDQRVLHEPKVCEVCDEFPVMQAMRIAWGIAFTGMVHPFDERGNRLQPCPAEAQRPLSLIERWWGNLPQIFGTTK